MGAEAPKRTLVARRVSATILVFKYLHAIGYYACIEVHAAEARAASHSLHVADFVGNCHKRNIEVSTTHVEDKDVLGQSMLSSAIIHICERCGCGLAEELKAFEAGSAG